MYLYGNTQDSAPSAKKLAVAKTINGVPFDGTANITVAATEDLTTAGALILGATTKATPADADQVGLMDSAASNILKKLSWANIKATLKAYFDAIYSTYASGSWTPVPHSLTTTGTPTYTGWWTRIGNRVFIELKITPGTNTTSTAGTTYFTGLPYAVSVQGNGSAIDGGINSLGVGLIYTTGSKVFTPTWAANASAIYYSGSYTTADPF